MTENKSNEKTFNVSSDDIHTNNETITTNEEQAKSRPVVPINNEMIREDMVKTAVNFLLNPRVIDSPLTQKRTFLLKKGLSLEEIDLAIDRCSRLTRTQNPNSQSINTNYSPQQMNGQPNQISVVHTMPSFLTRSSQFVSNAVLFGGFVYGVYVFYKRFIEPLLFEKSRKPHPFVAIQQQLDQLSKAMDILKENMSSIEVNIKKQIEDEIRFIKAPQDVTIHELKSELASIKALLVNRRQFSTTPVGAIPLWQMTDKEVNNKSDKQNDSDNLINGSHKDLNDEIKPLVVSNETNGFHDMTNGSVQVNGETSNNSTFQD